MSSKFDLGISLKRFSDKNLDISLTSHPIPTLPMLFCTASNTVTPEPMKGSKIMSFSEERVVINKSIILKDFCDQYR